MAQKKKKWVFLIVPLAVIFSTVLGFGVGHLFFSPKITGNKRFKLDIGVHGIRMVDPDEKKGDDLEFNDVWEKGVSPNDIPSLSPNGRRGNSGGGTTNNDDSSQDDENIQLDEGDDLPTVEETPEQSTPSATQGSSPAGNTPAYTDNSRKRNE